MRWVSPLVGTTVAWLAVGLGTLGLASPADAGPLEQGARASRAFSGLFAVEATERAPRAWARLFAPPPADPVRRWPAPPALADTAAQVTGREALEAPQTFDSRQPSITWGPLFAQSLAFLVLQHFGRAAFEKNTWEVTLEGAFWEDYFTSAGNLCCWDDGDKVTTNYLFHPFLGSAATFIFANNHRDSKRTPPGMTAEYWSAKGKQGVFAAAYSAYFELGLVLSEAAIGNVGLNGEGMTWLDLTVTPALGVVFSVGEDVLRKYVVDPIDRRNHGWGIVAALFLNPTRSIANTLAFKYPWADPPWLTLEREARARERVRAEALRAASTSGHPD